MADSKITALTALTSADPANDMIPIVDVSDTPPASGNTKRISINNILSSSPTASGALTVTGLVTAGSATITGALTVDTSTLVVDATNDRVGIGTATPGRPLEVYNTTESTVWAKTTTGISLFRSGGTSGDFYFGIDNSTAGGFGQGNYSRLIYSTGAYPIVFSTNATERARFNSTGNLAFANGLGIDFSAVTGGTGTATANVLNDYEEGTFTPTVEGTSTAGSATYSTQIARYTKVGRLVTFNLRVIYTGGTGTGNLRIAGLPFTTGFGANYAIYSENIALTAGYIAVSSSASSVTSIGIDQIPTGGGGALGVPYDAAGDIQISGSYTV